MNAVLSILENETKINLLKYAAGQQIFCSVCERILDWKETCVVSFAKTGRGSAILCDYCFLAAVNDSEDPAGCLDVVELDSAHNWHIVPSVLGKDTWYVKRGAQVLVEGGEI